MNRRAMFSRISRKSLVFFGRFALALLVFTQLAVAAQACMLSLPKPAVAFSSEAMPADCEAERGMSRNGCLAHCTQADQIAVSGEQVSDAPRLLAVLALAHGSVLEIAPRFHDHVAAHSGLSPYLRYQRLLI